MFSTRQQPMKGLYLAYQIPATLFFWLPSWILISTPPALRPRRSWTLSQCVGVRLVSHLFKITCAVGGIDVGPSHRALAQGKHIKAVWLDPVPHLINPQSDIAAFARAASVEAVRIPGYWIDKSGHDIPLGAPPASGEKVVLALHGGAYISGSGHPDNITANNPKGLLDHTPGDGNNENSNSKTHLRRVFCPEYRLACAPSGHAPTPFPGALFDALAAYDYLVNTVGFAPEDIIVEGDSAGANLCLALVKYLIEQREFLSSIGALGSEFKKALLPPGGLILFSPWCDLGTSHDHPASYISYFSRTDYIWNMPRSTAKWAHEVYAGPLGLKALDTSPWTSPASKHVKHVHHVESTATQNGGGSSQISFVGFPRTFIVCGGVEYFAPAIRTLKERLAADIGEDEGTGVTYYEAVDAVHDYCMLPWFEPQRTETLKVLGRWIAEM